MAITGAALRPGMQRWAGEQARILERIQRALDIIYRDRPSARTVEDLASAMLLATARRHEARVERALRRLDGALGRLLDDMDSLRGAVAEGRAPALREADLRAVADALAEMSRFEDHVRIALDKDPGELRSTMRGILGEAPGGHAGSPRRPRPAPAVGGKAAARLAPRSIHASRELAQHIIAEVDEVLAAWHQGWTREPPGVPPVRLPWRDHPVLAGHMRRMEAAVAAYRAAAPGFSDPARAARAVRRLQRAYAEGNETLRSFGRRFESVSPGELLPPIRPLPAGRKPARGSEAAKALAARGRAAALTGPSASSAEVTRALRFSDVQARATGVLSEPLARTIAGVGAERYILRPGEIRALPTRPPWLAARLADLVAGWQRAHLVGPGFGGEVFAGLMLAPWGVNQLAQNQGAERILRSLAAASRESGGPLIAPTITARGRRLAIPLANGGFEHVDLLRSVHYELLRPDLPPVRIDIHVNADGSWRVTHNLPTGTWPAGVPLSGAR